MTSPPISFFVPNEVASIEVVAEEDPEGSDFFDNFLQFEEEDGTVYYEAGNPIPGPILRLVDSSGEPVRYTEERLDTHRACVAWGNLHLRCH